MRFKHMNNEATTIPEALVQGAEAGWAMHFHLDDVMRTLPGDELVDAMFGGAQVLADRGVGPGGTVGILGPNHPEWVKWAFSTWCLGGTVVSLPYSPGLRGRVPSSERLQPLIQAAECQTVLVHPRFFDEIPPEVAFSWDASVPSPQARALPDLDPEGIAAIQFTSGSTASPKGATLSHQAILAASRSNSVNSGLGKDNPTLAWLPLFHDYGLFGFVTCPLVYGVDAHLMPTELMAKDPALWFRLIAEVGAGFTGGPASAWGAALKAALRDPTGIDLSPIVLAVLSAESIDPFMVDLILQVGGQLGLRPGTLLIAYGLAENVLGATLTTRGTEIRIDEVDIEELATSGRAISGGSGASKRIVSSGPPMPGVEVRIANDAGDVPDRHVAEILLRSPSLMSGYLGDAPDPFVDGWLRTGDLGYLSDGELFVTGRIKDLIIVMGNNYAPEDIEWAASRVYGVRPGSCIAFAAPGDGEGHVVVAVEPARDADPDALPKLVRKAVNESVGITVGEVVVLPRGSAPKTTSGKLRRSALRDAHARGELTPETVP
ncbi:MAG: AMP-binding protein [Actinomycetota bacterium]